MRRSTLSNPLACLLLLVASVCAKPQGDDSGRSSPWWISGDTSRTHLQGPPSASLGEMHSSPNVDLDLHLGLASERPRLDLNAAVSEERSGEHQEVNSILRPKAITPGQSVSLQRYTQILPMTLFERQRARHNTWYDPEGAVIGNAALHQTPLQHLPAGQASRIRQDGTFAAPVQVIDEASDQDVSSQDPAREGRQPIHPQRQATLGRFDFKTYDYDHPGLQHLMEPQLSPRPLQGHIQSSRGAEKVYRPDPDVLRAIEALVRSRVGDGGIYARLPNGHPSPYGSFLQPTFVEAEGMAKFMQTYRLQPVGFSTFLTIHPAAMDRAVSAVHNLKKAAKTVFFPKIRVGDVDHYIMAIPQRSKLPINASKVSGVLFHFWEGLAPRTYRHNFPQVRAYLGVMMLDQNRFERWTDIASLDTALWAQTVSHVA